MTRAYELALVINPDLSDAETERLLTSIKTQIEKFGGSILNQDVWGRKPTSYSLRGNSEAYYAFYEIELPAEKVIELDQVIKHTENIVRHLVTLYEVSKTQGEGK